jgi:hypothetical protein
LGAVGLPSGTLVLTSDGYREIENIKTGDLVLTHKCRWRKVIGVITGQDKVGTFQGNVKISMTSDVNIYSAVEVTHYPANENGKRKLQVLRSSYSFSSSRRFQNDKA